MNSLKDYTIFNSVNPDMLTPKVKRSLPFPLENFEEEMATAYEKVDKIFRKLEAACQNPVNDTPARKRRLKSLKYKTKTCLQLLKEINGFTSELWF